MNINDNNKYQLIDDFLSGGMSQKEIDSFKAFMQSDKDLAYDMNVVAEIEEASSFNVLENQLRDTLSNIRTERTAQDAQPLEGTKSNGLRYLALALGLAACLFVAFSIYTLNSDTSKTAIDYQQYAMVEPLNMTTKSDLSIAEFRSMQDLYNAGNYQEALPQLENYLATHPRDLDVLLAKGIAFSEIGNYGEAHKVFDNIESLNPRVKKYQWYNALAYVKEGNLTKAKSLLKKLVQNKGYNYEQAQKLLTSIK